MKEYVVIIFNKKTPRKMLSGGLPYLRTV